MSIHHTGSHKPSKAKSNGMHKGPATAWTLCEHGFEAIADFDYKA